MFTVTCNIDSGDNRFSLLLRIVLVLNRFEQQEFKNNRTTIILIRWLTRFEMTAISWLNDRISAILEM
jgi:hypothetical protein